MINKFKLLDPRLDVVLLIDVLSIISQLARISKEYYETIDKADIYADLKNLIVHEDP